MKRYRKVQIPSHARSRLIKPFTQLISHEAKRNESRIEISVGDGVSLVYRRPRSRVEADIAAQKLLHPEPKLIGSYPAPIRRYGK